MLTLEKVLTDFIDALCTHQNQPTVTLPAGHVRFIVDMFPDQDDTLPAIKAGQVWKSPNPKVKSKTITRMAEGRAYRGVICPHFLDIYGKEVSLHPKAFIQWAKRNRARPIEP